MTSDDEAAVVADLAHWGRTLGSEGDPAVEARPEGVTLQ